MEPIGDRFPLRTRTRIGDSEEPCTPWGQATACNPSLLSDAAYRLFEDLPSPKFPPTENPGKSRL